MASLPETQSNIYFGRKYCRKCRQVDVVVPRLHSSAHLLLWSRCRDGPADIFLMNGFLREILDSFPETLQQCVRCVSCFCGRTAVKVVSLL